MRPPLVAILAGAPAPASPLRPLDLAERVVPLDAEVDLDALRGIAEDCDLLWLPSWVVLDHDFARAVAAWRAEAPAVARGTPILRDSDCAIRLPRAVVGLPAATAEICGAAPTPRPGTRTIEFAGPLVLHPPTLSEHLRDLDRRSATAARLLDAAGQRSGIAALALRPLGQLARAMVGASGDRRAALARATLESYGAVLVQAKLWERRQVGTGSA